MSDATFDTTVTPSLDPEAAVAFALLEAEYLRAQLHRVAAIEPEFVPPLRDLSPMGR